MPWLILTVPEAFDGADARRFLKSAGSLSAANLRALRDRGGLLVNGIPTPGYAKLKCGDRVEADLSDPPAETAVCPGTKPEVLYADDWMAAIAKPAGIPTHASTFHPGEETMHERMASLWGERMVYHPVNRLDRNTSGVMCVARCGYMHERLKQLLHTDRFVRVYLAICCGVPDVQRGRIDLPIGREEGSVLRRTTGHGAAAVTDYRVLSRGSGRSLVLLRPRTGRTHQIRVHMVAIGCPLVGDFLYGEEGEMPRTALHSAALRIQHPISDTSVTAVAPVPADMMEYMDRYGLYLNPTEDLFDV